MASNEHDYPETDHNHNENKNQPKKTKIIHTPKYISPSIAASTPMNVGMNNLFRMNNETNDLHSNTITHQDNIDSNFQSNYDIDSRFRSNEDIDSKKDIDSKFQSNEDVDSNFKTPQNRGPNTFDKMHIIENDIFDQNLPTRVGVVVRPKLDSIEVFLLIYDLKLTVFRTVDM